MLNRENLYFPDLHVCIIRCFKAHKLDNNICLKSSQWTALAYIIFQDEMLQWMIHAIEIEKYRTYSLF